MSMETFESTQLSCPQCNNVFMLVHDGERSHELIVSCGNCGYGIRYKIKTIGDCLILHNYSRIRKSVFKKDPGDL